MTAVAGAAAVNRAGPGARITGTTEPARTEGDRDR